ncbi:MAG TPA: aromatic ring-hydroxylating dioxygenase subunit alpha [Stellaceae bacterium]|jgi:phenylpropionate dioxygenase-like ring-hydroxylating dioxygenase large terminal subunit|nr:aromatic ring-hydroxylating dioxygenase subunit alpha [Stellaceae bacterium]
MTATTQEVRAIIDALPPYAGNEAAAPMLPKFCYTSPEFFEFEREAVFARNWVCVGRTDQLAEPGAVLSASVAGEKLIVSRTPGGDICAMSAVCRHRGHVIDCTLDQPRGLLRCPLHYWTYDLAGRLVGAPRMGDRLAELRDTVRLPSVRHEIWHGFIFVNIDGNAPPLAPSLAKVEDCWSGYEESDLITVPPVTATNPVPWNWKVQLENFTDAYHPEFVHTGTHDFAPSNLAGDGVAFTPMADGDNAILRSVPMLQPDGGMMRDGWGAEAMFPAISSLSPAQRSRLTFVMVPPNLQLMFTPGSIAYTLLIPTGVEATYASSDRVTGGGWILPKSTVALPDFADRAATVRQGAGKIWAQDVPVNLAMQAGKRSRFMPDGTYGPLETTLVQFNAWLLRNYHRAGDMPP